MKICKEPGCNLRHSARGWCSKHYVSYKINVGFGQPKCSNGCAKPSVCRGLCSTCYNEAHRNGKLPGQKLCKYESCGQGATFSDGYCNRHHLRYKRHGDASVTLIGERGKGYITDAGYKAFEIDGKQVLEHRLIYAQYLGRELHHHEEIHHKNGNRADNRLSNLELWSVSQPKGQRIPDKIEYALYILSLYAPEHLHGRVDEAS